MNAKLHALVCSIVNIIQIVHTLFGNNKDTLHGMVIKNIKQNATHIASIVNIKQYRSYNILYTSMQKIELDHTMSNFKLIGDEAIIKQQAKRLEQMLSVQNEGFMLFKRKNADYGDAFAKYGPTGVIMRIEDKMQRYISITKSGVNLVETESLRDTLIDLHNYAAMAIMLLDEKEDK